MRILAMLLFVASLGGCAEAFFDDASVERIAQKDDTDCRLATGESHGTTSYSQCRLNASKKHVSISAAAADKGEEQQ
jgi:hypothetical protein